MEEKELKTSTKQRVFIILIAVIMLGSVIASYAAIVIAGSAGKQAEEATQIDDEKVAEYEEAYEKVVAEFKETSKSDYDKFVKFKSEVKGYNEAAANEGGVVKRDLKEGSGDKVTEDNYLAYYIGWCADETVFDSTFDDAESPTGFMRVLEPAGLVEGWNKGVEGMKIGGIREITIPGELAYGETREICGGTNKPLKFIVMAVKYDESLKELATEVEEAYMRYQYAAQYGVDYDTLVTAGE